MAPCMGLDDDMVTVGVVTICRAITTLLSI